MKKQLPFDPALLSRFHLVFLLRKPSKKEFLEIAKSIVEGSDRIVNEKESEFVKQYVAYAQKTKVEFDKKLQPVITDFFEGVKDREQELLIELSPRLVVGVVRLSKAVARLSLRSKVTHDDVREVLGLVEKSLVIPKDSQSKKG